MSAHLPVERIRVVSGGLARVLTTPLALVPHRTLGPARSSRVTTHAREPGSSFRNVALLNQSRKKATSPRHSIAAHARSDPDAMATQIAKKIVVVGGGNSAGYFARAVVAAGRGADLLICSAEEVLPYERPALTKAFLNETGPARLPGFHTSVGGGGERQNQEWYDANGVEVHLGTRVVAWDPSAKTVTTDKSTSIGYEKLIVAIGCTALKLPASMGGDLPGVHYVRDNADALSLYDAMAGAKAPVVIGGGEFFFIFVWEIRLTTSCFVHRLHRPGGRRELRRAEHEPGRGHDGTTRHGPSLVPGDRGALREPVRVQGYDVSQKRQGQGHQQGTRRRRRISRARRQVYFYFRMCNWTDVVFYLQAAFPSRRTS